jgi:hypothetical protein
MRPCSRCGSWNKEAAKFCNDCGTALDPTVTVHPPRSAERTAPAQPARLPFPACEGAGAVSNRSDRDKEKFLRCTGLFTVSLVAAVWLLRGAEGELHTEFALALASLLVAIAAYWQLPKDYPWTIGPLRQTTHAGLSDLADGDVPIARGRYNAWIYVHLAFFLQLFAAGYLIALLVAWASGRESTDYSVLGVATSLAAAATIWIFSDRWGCIEAFSSRACSGLANFSIFYVPIVALIYANYRGFRKIWGR